MNIDEIKKLVSSKGTKYCLIAGKMLMVYAKNDRVEMTIKLTDAQKAELMKAFPYLGK